jgi:hypothetical protein
MWKSFARCMSVTVVWLTLIGLGSTGCSSGADLDHQQPADACASCGVEAATGPSDAGRADVGAPSAEPVAAAACTAIADLHVSSSGPTGIGLAWSGSPGVIVSIARKSYCGVDSYLTLTTLPAGAAAYTDSTVEASWNYWYEIVATDSDGAQASAALATQAASAPLNACAGGAAPQQAGVSSSACTASGSDGGISTSDAGGQERTDAGAGDAAPPPTATSGHGALRGRVYVDGATGTLRADDGSLLRMTHGYVHDFVYSDYTSLAWWQQMHDIGHFNVVRVMAFLGGWPNSAQTMDVATLTARLDIMVGLAAQSGMYVLIDNHSECCGAMNEANDTNFWNAVAPRYANATNVIYELKNEPSYSDTSALAGYEERMYARIRGYAPHTHIICWTISQPLDIASSIMAMFARADTSIDYTNASVGVHPYNAAGNVSGLLSLYRTINAKYPLVMTEVVTDGDSGAPPGESFVASLEQLGISWALLEGQGFKDASTGTVYGWVGSTDPGITITWPED